MIQLALVLSLLSPALGQALAPTVPATLAAPLREDPLGVTIHRLKNGLTVYLSPNRQQPRVTAWIAVRAGSKHDPADSTGMAHYLEHMLFKGSSNFGTADHAKEKPVLDRILALYEKRFAAKDPGQRERIYKEIDRENQEASRYAIPNELAKVYRQLGFRGLNAFTSDEETVYVCDFPSNRAEAWARMEVERFSRPVFRLFQTELEAVYEEKNRSLDNPERIVGEALNRLLYKAHPYGQQPTLGSIEHLKNPSLAKMYEFYDRWYRPNNMALILSGDLEPKAMLALLERHFGAWNAKPLPPAKTWPVPEPKGREAVEVKYEAEEKVLVSWLTVPLRHPDADALSVMDMLMDNSAAGIINLTLNQAQKVKASGSFPGFYNDAGDWTVWAVPKLGQTLEQAEGLLLETVAKLKAGEFTDEDIRSVITAFEVSEKGRLESNEGRVSLMAHSFVHFEPWPETVSRLERLRRVTKEDVLRVARRYIGEGRVVAYRRNGKPELPDIQKPGFTKVPLDESRVSAFAAKILALPAVPPTPRWLVEGRDYRVSELPSGRLYAVPNPFNDLFSLSFNFDLGRLHKRRLCAALNLLELSGAGELTAEEYKKRLFALGTTVSYSCGEQESTVSVSGLDKNLWASLELLRRRFEAPSIATDTLKKMVEVELGAHQDNKKDPEYISYALGEWVRRGAESSVLTQLSDPELKALGTKDLAGLIRELPSYKRRAAYVGNRAPGEIAQLLAEPRGYKDAPRRRPVRYRKPAADSLAFAHRDMVQSQVGAFLPDEVYDPARAADYQFLGSYLGGGMSAVIFQEIREARALAYSSWGGYGVADYKGEENTLYGGLGCQADKTLEATALLRELLRAPPWTEKRFSETAKAVEEGYRSNPIQFRSVAPSLMAWADLGLAGDPRPARFERVLRYRLDDLKAFSSRLKDRPMALYILGNRERLGLAGLKGLGGLEEKTLEQLFPY